MPHWGQANASIRDVAGKLPERRPGEELRAVADSGHVGVWPNRVVRGSYDAEVIALNEWLLDRTRWMHAEIDQ